MGTMLQGYDLTLDDFDQLEGCNEVLNRHPARRRPGHPRRLLRGRRRRGRDQHLRRQPVRARRVRHLRPDLRAGRGGGAGSPGSRRTRTARPTARGGCSAASGPGTKLPTLGHVAYAPAAGRLPDPGRGDAGRRHRRRADRDLAGSAADQGRHPRRQTGPGPRRARPAAHRARHGRDHRHHAARLGDRRRADRARAARHRPDRAELRHRAGRDERAPAAPVPVRRRSGSAACPTPGCRS